MGISFFSSSQKKRSAKHILGCSVHYLIFGDSRYMIQDTVDVDVIPLSSRLISQAILRLDKTWHAIWEGTACA